MLGLCYLNGSEMDEGHPERKYKGRVVFSSGDRAKDQYGATVVFKELASSLAGVEARKFCVAYGLVEGHTIEQADADTEK